jgi:hypothetical protein
MKTSTQTKTNNNACSIRRREPDWALRITPGLEFNARAVRARAGLLNLLIGSAIALLQINPTSDAITYILLLLLFDMVAVVFVGLTSYSPLGVAATLMTKSFEPQWTPHLPKRFAWSMGTGLAATCLALHWSGASEAWTTIVLGSFFILTWLDAALGFCLGCWIYSRLFGCRTCHLG